MRVYLAGKIKKNDWRHDIFHRLRDVDPDDDSFEFRPPVADGFEYSGPYFIADDHGSYHGDGTHGRGVGLDEEKNFLMSGEPDRRSHVVKKCLNWLGWSDIVFCWLDSPDAYGTMVELGFAKALQKPIFLAVDKKLISSNFSQDSWFAQAMSNQVVYADNAMLAWQMFLKQSSDIFKNTAIEYVRSGAPITESQANLLTSLLIEAKKELIIPIHKLSSKDAGAIIQHLRYGSRWPQFLPPLIANVYSPDAFIYKASEIVDMVNTVLKQTIQKYFTMHNHFICSQHYDVKSGNTMFCKSHPIYDGTYRYSQHWADFLIKELSNEETYNKLFPPKKKTSK